MITQETVSRRSNRVTPLASSTSIEYRGRVFVTDGHGTFNKMQVGPEGITLSRRNVTVYDEVQQGKPREDIPHTVELLGEDVNAQNVRRRAEVLRRTTFHSR